ncbi:hypothetical protein SDC9_159973 [bioreactor metagenome]|uniref:Uncharacterized protein n=1 Tax=bioreactor metagenome TaxID=1076179 RepID=A0A645FJQ1_9ZZZZ
MQSGLETDLVECPHVRRVRNRQRQAVLSLPQCDDLMLEHQLTVDRFTRDHAAVDCTDVEQWVAEGFCCKPGDIPGFEQTALDCFVQEGIGDAVPAL